MSLAPGSFAETPRLADLLEETVRHRRSLSEFVGTTAPLAIEGSQSGIEIEIPFSPRIEVLGGEVEILHDHAARPADWSSQLGISWDDRVISSSTIQAEDRRGKVDAAFAGTAEPVSVHRLKVESRETGQFGEGVEPGSLLTQIDAVGSGISIDYRLRPLRPLLDELRDLIDERYWGDYSLSILTAPLYSVEQTHLTWGNLVSQRAAIWMGRRPLKIMHQDSLAASLDQVAIGTRAELIGILPKSICDQITTSFVGIYPHPSDDRHFLLVLSGTESEGVERAVRAFAFSPEEFPGMARVDVTGWPSVNGDLPKKEKADSRWVILPDLERWQREGFPGATGVVGGGGCDLWITARDSGTLASAWMISGRLAQVEGDLVPSLNVTDHLPEARRHWFAIGPVSSLDPEWLEKTPLAQAKPVEGEALLCQFESPMKKGFAGGIVTAADSLILSERVSDLIQPNLWKSLRGDTVLWSAGGAAPRFQKLAASFEVGEPGLLTIAWRWISALPWLSLAFSSLGALIVLWLLRQPMTSGRDWDLVPAKKNANRKVSRSRRLKEVARREARLFDTAHRGG
ncbi:MAG: cellulose biosynthesis cyclic di-GMP-binding regulatory protein BcsB [Verrucomicrobiae bacterium]|nr:cellulose biosynthesis cyclic di-GMP-binding regulatory protein BcsB [Verrucomicrobiae bacterium]